MERNIAITSLLAIVIVFLFMVKALVKELITDNTIKVQTVYPPDYDPNATYTEDIKKHWRNERIVASAAVMAYESYDHLDEAIYRLKFWPPRVSPKEVSEYLKEAAEIVNSSTDEQYT